MTRERAIARRYLLPETDAFWEWQDDGRTIAWRDGPTIAFQAELEAVLERLAPQGLPPFNAVVLFLAACRSGASEQRLEGLDRALNFLCRVRAPNEAVKTWTALVKLSAELSGTPERKAELAAVVFEAGRPFLTPGDAAVVQRELRRGLVREIHDLPLEDGDGQPLAWLRAFATSAGRIDPARIALRQKTGLEQLPRARTTEMPPAESLQALLKSLQQDQELGGLVRLARSLTAALTLPRAVSQPDELPLGGVSDISNRGAFDRLLVSELAQDDLTFTVRVALSEALYLRRESPPNVPPRKRMILIDSGLRMWGVPRIFATAAAMALAATRRRRDGLGVYRPHGAHLDHVDLDTREGLVAHLAVLEPNAHPGAALPTFRRLLEDEGSVGEAVLITGDDVWADRSFRQAIDSAELPLLYVVMVNRDGRLRLARRSPQGTKFLRESQFRLEEILEPSPRAAPLVDRQINPELPAILHLRPFPLLLPHSINAERIWLARQEDAWELRGSRLRVSEGALFSLPGDGRLMFWNGKDRGARQLCDTLPRGALLWEDSGKSARTDSTAMIGTLHRGELFLLHSHPQLKGCQVVPLAVQKKNPRGVAAHAGAIFVIFDQEIEVFTQANGERLQSLSLGKAVWKRDRFFAIDRVWVALSFDGSTARFEPVRHDANGELIGMFDCEAVDGPIGITRDGALRFFYDRQPATAPGAPAIVEPRLAGHAGYQLAGVSSDGYRLVLTEPGVRTSSLVDLRNGSVTRVRGNPRAALAMHLFSMISISNFTLRKKFRSIGVEGYSLVLVPSQGGANLQIVLDADEMRLVTADSTLQLVHPAVVIVSPSLPARSLHGFVETPSPPGTGYRLAVARWEDGSRAFLDSRGLLHLKSSDSSIPELTLVLFEKFISGWCSDGRVWGNEYFTGDLPRTDPRTIYEDVYLPFVSKLR